jgi:hypothetical protein
MRVVYSRWNEKAYPDVVKRRIWYFVGELPQKSFEKIIYTLLDTCRAAPMPNEFRMLAYAERDRLGLNSDKEPEVKPSREAKCWDCGDSGNLFATHKTKNTSAVFRCHCKIGAERPVAQGAQWTREFARQWEIDRVYPDIKGDWRPNALGLSLVDLVNEYSGIKRREHRSSELQPVKKLLNENSDPDGGDAA